MSFVYFTKRVTWSVSCSYVTQQSIDDVRFLSVERKRNGQDIYQAEHFSWGHST